jgi:hypothetical protein
VRWSLYFRKLQESEHIIWIVNLSSRQHLTKDICAPRYQNNLARLIFVSWKDKGKT